MRILIFSLLVVAACTKHNPDSCCSTVNQCSMLGIDGVTGCASGKACDGTGTCVAAQCSTSADCSNPASPICEDKLCVAKCVTDDECVGVAGAPYCATDGGCVACVLSSQCGADAPICDAMTSACRGCTQDSECPGAVCHESDGTCVLDSNVAFVKTGGSDATNCTREAPCLTLNEAISKLGPRSTIHILGATYSVGPTTQSVSVAVYIDGENTTVFGADTVFLISNGANPLVLNNLSIPASVNAITFGSSGGKVILNQTTVQGIAVTNNSILEAKHSTLTPVSAKSLTCNNSTIRLESITATGEISTSNCQADVRRSRIMAGSGNCVLMTGGTYVFENNLLIASNDIDCALFGQAGPGSAVRFNTIFNVTSSQTDRAALSCDNTATTTNNIIAYNSRYPHSGPCVSNHSLYDLASMETAGTGNVQADISTFFTDSVGLNFHLAIGSPAIGKAEMVEGVTMDLEGNPRPSPVGSQPDIGAYEAP